MIEIIPNWHPIFVHFTVGLLLTSALFHLAAMLASSAPLKQALTHAANWTLWVGAGITVATVTAGWIAFNSVNHDTPSHLAMIEHRNWAMVTFAAYVVVAIWSFLRTKHQASVHWPLIIAVGAAGILLLSTAWHGGELVYRYGLGVESLPNPDEHIHAEGAAHAHSHEDHVHEHDAGHDEPPHDEAGGGQEAIPGPAEGGDASGISGAQESQDTAEPVQPQSGHTHEPGSEHTDHDH